MPPRSRGRAEPRRAACSFRPATRRTSRSLTTSTGSSRTAGRARSRASSSRCESPSACAPRSSGRRPAASPSSRSSSERPRPASRAARSHTGVPRRRARRVAGLGAGGGSSRGDRGSTTSSRRRRTSRGRRRSPARAWPWRRRRAASRCWSPTRSSRAASRSRRWRRRPSDRVPALLPSYVTVANPLDITAGLPDETFGEVLATVARDPGVDVVVVPLTLATAGGERGSRRARHQGGARRDASRWSSAGPAGRSCAKGFARSMRLTCRSSRPCRAAPPPSAPPWPSARSGPGPQGVTPAAPPIAVPRAGARCPGPRFTPCWPSPGSGWRPR